MENLKEKNSMKVNETASDYGLEPIEIPGWKGFFIKDPTYDMMGYRPIPTKDIWPMPEGFRKEVEGEMPNEETIPFILKAFKMVDDQLSHTYVRRLINQARLRMYLYEVTGFYERNPEYLHDLVLADGVDLPYF